MRSATGGHGAGPGGSLRQSGPVLRANPFGESGDVVPVGPPPVAYVPGASASPRAPR
ncbi:MAG TPA: hypothetical protein VNP92_06805 [Actinophytocola sp.]|nr:hypothetical protein [Actinophytocola sp.]